MFGIVRLLLVVAIVVPLIIVTSWTYAIVTADSPDAILVRIIETWKYSPPSPDPSGLTYDRNKDLLMISDAEVDEITALSKGVNIFGTDRTGSLTYRGSTINFSDEPTGISIDSEHGQIYISDDDHHVICQITASKPDQHFSSDDLVTCISTLGFSKDPEGLAYESSNQSLYVLDGKGVKLHVLPQVHSMFLDPDAYKMDQVESYDLRRYGVWDPEGIETDSATGDIYIVGRSGKHVTVLSKNRKLLKRISLPLRITKPSGIALAPSTQEPGKMGLFISDRGIDNNHDPNENDGRIYEFLVP